MATPRIVISPGMNVSKDALLTVEGFTSEMKVITAKAVTEGWSEHQLGVELQKIVEKYYKVLPPSIRAKATSAVITMAKTDYFMLNENMKVLNRALLQNFSPEAVKALISDNPAIVITQDKLRGLDIVNAKGNPMVDDYYKKVKEQMRVLAAKGAEHTEAKDGKATRMSLRNLAEMTVRYEAGQEDVANLKAENVKLVWTSSHEDASGRCEPFQGKLYSLDGSTGVTADGVPYTPLEDAERGIKGDGNGIITGYNCRHFLIEYQPGSKSPKEYAKTDVKRERYITAMQRNKETAIRHSKLAKEIAVASGDKQEAKRLQALIERETADYQAYSMEMGRPIYKWRTQISAAEGETGSYINW